MQKNAVRRTKEIAYIVMFSAIIAVCSWISIPGPVPFTLQTFGVFAACAMLGGRRGLVSVIIYIMLGMIGLPVFAGFSGGIGILAGSTGGYIIGFVFTAMVMWLVEKLFGSKWWIKIVGMVLGLVACYAFGTFWFVRVYTNTTGAITIKVALMACVVPFIPIDLVKIALASILDNRLGKYVNLGETSVVTSSQNNKNQTENKTNNIENQTENTIEIEENIDKNYTKNIEKNCEYVIENVEDKVEYTINNIDDSVETYKTKSKYEKIIKLRPHHLMCLRYFCNNGYSDDFCQNMTNIRQRLTVQDNVEIVQGCDDICAKCPNNKSGKCISLDVVEYDQRVLDMCKNLKIGHASYQQAYTTVYDEILSKGKRQSICGDCRWNELCKNKE